MRTTNRWREELSSIAGGFGTVFDDGYGISYLVYEHYGKAFTRDFSENFCGDIGTMHFVPFVSVVFNFLLATSSLYSTVSWSVHSKRSSARTDSKEFAEHISQAMEDMRELYNA